MRVAETWDNALTRESARVPSEMRSGKPKGEGLRERTDRCNAGDLKTFAATVIRAGQLP